MNILLTGGAGYIGSHTAVSLIKMGFNIVILDNFCNSHQSVLNKLEKILGKPVPCIEGDVRDTKLLTKTLQDYNVDSVIHLAGLKAVGASTKNPVDYYANNVQGTISLLEAMKRSGLNKLVFSSSATVYGEPQYLPIDEGHPTGATNPYGRSKLHVEELLSDLAHSDISWKIACLRYFNPVGAHESGLIGENPQGTPNNLMPFIAQVALGKIPHLNVFGDDYDTVDGTGVRDYIHVMDLAEGHVAALKLLEARSGFNVFNLGTGYGSSVLEMVEVFALVSQRRIPLKVVARRIGDVDSSYASANKALQEMGWRANRSFEEACQTSWNYLQKNLELNI